jgi:hypothetical protein
MIIGAAHCISGDRFEPNIGHAQIALYGRKSRVDFDLFREIWVARTNIAVIERP